MESNEARDRLADLERLGANAATEGRRHPTWSFFALAIGATVALGIVWIGNVSPLSCVAAAVVWNAIVWGWTYVTARGRRVEAAREPVFANARIGALLVVAGNVVLWTLWYFFGAATFFLIGGAYVVYLVYIAMGDMREAARRSRRA